MDYFLIAAISGESLLWLVVTIIVIGLIFWLLDWALKSFALPEPFAKIARVVLVLAAVLFLIKALLTVVGHPLIRW